MQKWLIDPVTLTFDLLTPKAYHFEHIFQGHHLWDHSFLSYAADKQTNKQTNSQSDRQTDRQPDGLENPTDADRHRPVGVVNNNITQGVESLNRMKSK